MSYENIEKARAKRAAKEVLKDNGKRAQKRKSSIVEADEPEPEPEPDRANNRSSNAMRGPGGADDLSADCRR